MPALLGLLELPVHFLPSLGSVVFGSLFRLCLAKAASSRWMTLLWWLMSVEHTHSRTSGGYVSLEHCTLSPPSRTSLSHPHMRWDSVAVSRLHTLHVASSNRSGHMWRASAGVSTVSVCSCRNLTASALDSSLCGGGKACLWSRYHRRTSP